MEKSKLHTTKRMKVIGTETYINQASGEIEEMQVIQFTDRDFNFHKIWLQYFINSIELIGNQKLKVAFYVIDNLDEHNRFIGTLRKVADQLNISLDTVRKTMTALQEADFLRKIQAGVYQVNPDIIFKGSQKDRLNVLTVYQKEG